MDERDGQQNPKRWRARPWLALLLQSAVMVLPIVAASLVGIGVVRLFPPAVTGSVALTWVIAGAAAMLSVKLLQPLYKRLMPLAWLLRIGMLFPGTAPSRFRIARSAGRIRDLERQLDDARRHGVEGDAEQGAARILSLVTALTNHDRRTRGHAERVRVFTDLLTTEMGLPQGDRDRLRWASLLHDIGKLEVPEKVLNKASKPSKYEWALLHRHPVAGDRIIEPLREWLGEWADAALHHHERWDGTGYPNGLAGNEISLAGRIVSVADCYEVMTATRAYKRPMSAIAAREELVRCSSTQFDPAIVRSFLLIPLSRLRWALGPFAWFAQLPIARSAVHHGHQAVARVPEAVAMGEAVAVSTAVISVGAASSASAAEVEFPGVVQEQASGQAADVLGEVYTKVPIEKGSSSSGGSGVSDTDEGSGDDGSSSLSSSGSSSSGTTQVLGQTRGNTTPLQTSSGSGDDGVASGTTQQTTSSQTSSTQTQSSQTSSGAGATSGTTEQEKTEGSTDEKKESESKEKESESKEKESESKEKESESKEKDDSGSSGAGKSSGKGESDGKGNKGGGGGGPPDNANQKGKDGHSNAPGQQKKND